jgi:acyl-coenzyme A synthetase/AMP-(fatty) acid ligase
MLFFLDPVSNFSATYAELFAAIGSAADIGAASDSGSASENGLARIRETNSIEASPSYAFIVNLLRQLLQRQPQIELRILAANAGLLEVANPGRTRNSSTSSGDSTCGSSISERSNSAILNSDSTQIALNLSDLNSAWQSLLDSPSRILLETSGSTGQPKTVWYSIASLTRGMRLGEEHRDSIWGLAYPLDHLAGLQVLFQGLLNFNPLIQLYRLEPFAIHHAIDHQQITHLSCTPTFLRMLLAADSIHPSLRRLTNGGERYDRELDQRIRRMFPNAQRRNIYASTEVGPLLVSDNDQFRIPNHLLNALRIIDGELWLHQDLRVDTDSRTTGKSDHRSHSANQSDSMTVDSEGFFTNDLGHSETVQRDFFPTGDQVEIINERPLTIRFLSRKTEGFNVAGFRVDPHRLESIARQHPLIANARFYGMPNSVTEHVVACDLVLNRASSRDAGGDASGNRISVLSDSASPDGEASGTWHEDQFRTWFAERVQRHELPRIIKIVPQLSMTESGKVNRRN